MGAIHSKTFSSNPAKATALISPAPEPSSPAHWGSPPASPLDGPEVATTEGQNFYVFRGREAHAWTEIHLKNHGWVIFDTTPVSRGEGSPSVANQDEESPTDFNEMTDERRYRRLARST